MCRTTDIVCIIISFAVSSISSDQNVGPYYKTTHGEVWPKPANQLSYAEYLKFEPENFRFNVKNYSCYILQDALKRYKNILFLKSKRTTKSISTAYVIGILDELNVHMLSPCENYPSLNMDEKYEIKINGSSTGALIASSIWGILRGLETFSQLVTLGMDGSTFTIRRTSILDYPKFKHRGFLLDTSRHYLPVQTIYNMLDAMAYSKLNVFHWHIVDDQSFPYQSNAFPKLSEKGAYGSEAIYTRNDIRLIIEYARHRGIRVIPEFDTPGHTLSWRFGGIPGLLAQCSDSDPNSFGPIDPTIEENYNFLKKLLTEVYELFKDQYLHLGGDEVEFTISCWANNKRIQQFMQHNNITSVIGLEDYYFQQIFKITRQLISVPIVWEEVFDKNINLDSNTVVHVWKTDFNSTIKKVIKSGHPVLLSSCWYLNYIKYGSDWVDFYKCDPSTIREVREHKDLFLGGEACMWGEFVDETNVLSRSWPRASAVAEVLWSQVLNETEAMLRLEEHVCRMKRRGIPAEPANGPNYCTY